MDQTTIHSNDVNCPLKVVESQHIPSRARSVPHTRSATLVVPVEVELSLVICDVDKRWYERQNMMLGTLCIGFSLPARSLAGL